VPGAERRDRGCGPVQVRRRAEHARATAEMKEKLGGAETTARSWDSRRDNTFAAHADEVGPDGPIVLGAGWDFPERLACTAAGVAAGLGLHLVCAYVNPASYLTERSPTGSRLPPPWTRHPMMRQTSHPCRCCGASKPSSGRRGPRPDPVQRRGRWRSRLRGPGVSGPRQKGETSCRDRARAGRGDGCRAGPCYA
jgi:hypothetical protein